MDFNVISPYIRVAMDSVIQPPWHLHERVIFDYELLYVKEGQIEVTVEDQSYIGKPGDIFLFKPKERHSMTIVGEKAFRQPHLHFDLFYREDSPQVEISFKALQEMCETDLEKFRQDVTKEPSMNLPNKIVLKNTAAFEELLFEIIKEYEMKLPFYEMTIKGLFIRLWTGLLRENYWQHKEAISGRIQELMQIKDYLYGNIHRDITLSELSTLFNISKYHLLRLFKNAFGISPIQYHRMMRIEKAKNLIQFTGMTITAISDQLGFDTMNSFSRLFKMVAGVAPSYYRTGRT